ncbi:hypothetical protein [Silvibacterium sp.]|uniref:hypothetical protein n=1 Tax=Silvibacterium sp. TaxID=1964179 RepID=UPI0039E348AD
MSDNIVIPLGFFAAFIWLASIVFTNLRRSRIARRQAELQAIVLHKLESSQSLLAYSQTEAGRQFLDGLTLEREQRTPYSRILNSVQAGIILTCFGAAMLFLRSKLQFPEEGFTVFGTLAVGLGIGFGISGAASYLLSRSFGLLEVDSVRRG